MSATPATLIMHRPELEPLGTEQNNRQRFALGPLEPGFGYTIGSSLRRTLLSSIPGAAITRAVFDEALHEFATIEGVVEDVTDIVLNLKDVVLRSHTDQPVAVRIDFVGPGELQAGDVEWGADLECLNPELYLVTMAEEGRLALDVTVQKGWGYLASIDPRVVDTEGDTKTIGAIAIDAIFSPVRRVAIEVEPMRVEQATNYDRLILDVETDGAMTPAEALASAGATLSSLFTMVTGVADNAEGLVMPDEDELRRGTSELDLPIEELELPERAKNALKREGINTVGDILANTADELRRIANFGEKSFNDVVDVLDERGLTLRGLKRPLAEPPEELIGLPEGEPSEPTDLIGLPEDSTSPAAEVSASSDEASASDASDDDQQSDSDEASADSKSDATAGAS